MHVLFTAVVVLMCYTKTNCVMMVQINAKNLVHAFGYNITVNPGYSNIEKDI